MAIRISAQVCMQSRDDDINVDVPANDTAAGIENGHERQGMMIKERSADAEPPDGVETGAPLDDNGQPIQVRLDDVTDLPEVNSAEAANVSGIR